MPVELGRRRDYWLGTTLFNMRRRYGEAGTLLLGVWQASEQFRQDIASEQAEAQRLFSDVSR